MSARILVFPQKALVRTELQSKKEQQAQSVQERTKAEKRTAHAREAGTGTAKYLKTQFRNDLKTAGDDRRAFALQLWSALHPDPKALRPVRPMVDAWRYAAALLERIEVGQFRSPPAIARVRRDQMRNERCKVLAKRRAEARRLADVTAMLARGEYPGLG